MESLLLVPVGRLTGPSGVDGITRAVMGVGRKVMVSIHTGLVGEEMVEVFVVRDLVSLFFIPVTGWVAAIGLSGRCLLQRGHLVKRLLPATAGKEEAREKMERAATSHACERIAAMLGRRYEWEAMDRARKAPVE